jgi:protein-S-isoprenylcysteine O-methyltransferase Ste14
MNDDLFLRRTIVAAGVLIYWLGVLVQSRRIRLRIGRSPNLRPRGARERWLWIGWSIVIVIWFAQPLLADTRALPHWLQIASPLLSTPGLVAGIAMTAAGYTGTLWCYTAMGDTWRIGIDRREKNTLITRGPYRLVRHPIYLFQILMLAGALLLLPGILSLLVLAVHLICVAAKVSDEESHLLNVHCQQYRDYMTQTGRLFPRWISK